MKNYSILFVLLLTTGSLMAQVPAVDDSWLSEAPIDIPVEARRQMFGLGNLVQNADFEQGTENWTLDKEASIVNEGPDGSQCLKVYRGYVDLTSVMKGAESDYIAVMPGNYQFTADVRLENIQNPKWRKGVKLNDAVNIRVKYYDKDKNEIQDYRLHPDDGRLMDNSIKEAAFANFWLIPEMEWSELYFHTGTYSFLDGDVPNNCRYVKLFFGLTGQGTIWVDNVDYRMSKWNFTPLERMAPYIEKDYTLPQLLFPTPKLVQPGEKIQLDAEGKQGAVIVMPANADKQMQMARNLLVKELRKALEKGKVQVLNELSAKDAGDYALVINLGQTNLYEEEAGDIPHFSAEETEQSYTINYTDARPNIIYIKAAPGLGSYYGAATLVQLIDPEEKTLHACRINDWPDMKGRSVKYMAWKTREDVDWDVENMDFFTQLKFNKGYVSYGKLSNNWYDPEELYFYACDQMGKAAKDRMELYFMINPYIHFGFEKPASQLREKDIEIFNHSSEESLQRLLNTAKIGLDRAEGGVMLCTDDFVPHTLGNQKYYSLYTEEDYERFTNLQNAQAYVINELYDWMEENYPGSELEFVPPWYWNEAIDRSWGKARYYFIDLARMIPEDVRVIWTGNTVRTLFMDRLDVLRFEELLGRKPMLWDNTLYARKHHNGGMVIYPGKGRMACHYEPWDVWVPEDFYKLNDDHHMYANGYFHGYTYNIKAMTLADFEWNNNAYNADESLWKAMLKLHGKELSLLLLENSDAFYAFQDMLLHIIADGKKEKYMTKAEAYREKMDQTQEELEDLIDSELFINEFKEESEDLKKDYITLIDGIEGAIEVEKMKVLENKGGGYKELTGYSVGINTSDGRFILFTSKEATENTLALEFELEEGGEYLVEAGMITWSNLGYVDLYIDGQQVGQTMDTYTSKDRGGMVPFELGTIEIGPGTHTLKLKIQESHPKVNGHIKMAMDYIRFIEQ